MSYCSLSMIFLKLSGIDYLIWFLKQSCETAMPTITVFKILLYGWGNRGSEVKWLTRGIKVIGQKAMFDI